MSALKLLTWYFGKKLSPKKIEEALNCVTENSNFKRPAASNGKTVVSCVQLKTVPLKKAEGYASSLAVFVREAAEKGASVVVFPEYNFFSLLGMIPGFTAVNGIITRWTKKVLAKDAPPPAQEPSGVKNSVSDTPIGLGLLFMAIAEPLERAICQLCSGLASAFCIYVYSGSFVSAEDGRLFNKGCLFAPDGSLVGSQKKLHLTDAESAMGMSRGDTLNIFDLPFGRTVFPVCMDATYFETFRIAAENGVEIVLLPISDDENDYGTYKALRGIWVRVQESYVIGIKASQNGWIAGMHFTGKAGIFAPLEITPKLDGVLALSDSPEGSGLKTAVIDLEELRRARSDAMYFGDRNPEFEKNYFEMTYSSPVS